MSDPLHDLIAGMKCVKEVGPPGEVIDILAADIAQGMEDWIVENGDRRANQEKRQGLEGVHEADGKKFFIKEKFSTLGIKYKDHRSGHERRAK